MDKFYNIPEDTKAEILRNTGEKANLPAYAVDNLLKKSEQVIGG